MGQAKQRRSLAQAFERSLDRDEARIYEVSRTFLRRAIIEAKLAAACYRATFFLRLLLAEEGIETEAVVGWINDGSDGLMISHAWLEHRGRKVDLTLAVVDEGLSTGDVLILDQVISRGQRRFSYHRVRPEAAVRAEAEAIADAPAELRDAILGKPAEHEQMTMISTRLDLMRVWLDEASDGWTYDRYKALVSGT